MPSRKFRITIEETYSEADGAGGSTAAEAPIEEFSNSMGDEYIVKASVEAPVRAEAAPRRNNYLKTCIFAGCGLLVAAIIVVTVLLTRPANSAEDLPQDNIYVGNVTGSDEHGGEDGDLFDPALYNLYLPVLAYPSKTYEFTHNESLDLFGLHKGWDFSCVAGTEVVAVSAGTVASVENNNLYGGVLTIEHADGLTTVYRFIKPLESLKLGDKVNKGEGIGTVIPAMGAEASDGDHLHFEIYRNGVIQDPQKYYNLINQ